jgi:hypothetical protein
LVGLRGVVSTLSVPDALPGVKRRYCFFSVMFAPSGLSTFTRSALSCT